MSQGEQRIREIYEAALTRPPGERASYVAKVAGPDTELRERVEALLSGQVDTVLPGYEPGGEVSEQLLGTGTQIGSYRIEGPLGAGGMGVVYFATDTKLDRPAAIKVLPQGLADSEARRRFQREARLVSSLNHPHIVTVYDAGEYRGRQYLITEYVDGGTLRRWASEPRGWQAIVELLIGVADGIAVAHEAGILHRDIKPENILLAKNGYAKLADFGIAKLLESDPLADDPHLSLPAGQHSTRVGTAAYMSPEQLQGRALDARSDVYSFGLVLHELLAGRRTFAEVADPSAPRTLSPLPAELPAELQRVIGKALEVEPANRYQTMRDFVVDLRRLVRRTEAEIGKVGRPWWRRSLGYAAAAVVALVVALVLRDYRSTVPEPPPPHDAVAVLPFTNDTGNADDAQLTEDLGDGVRDRLTALPGFRVLARPSSVSFASRDSDTRKIASTLGVGRLVRGSLKRRGELLDVRVEILDDQGFAVRPPLPFTRPETQLLALVQEIARQVGAVLAPASAAGTTATPTAQAELANRLVLIGLRREREVKDELSVDEPKMREAIDLYRRAAEADRMSLAAYSHLAAALLYLGDASAGEAVEAMVALAEGADLHATSNDLADAYYTFGLYLIRARKSDGVEKAYQDALRYNPSHADAHGAYAQWLMMHTYAGEGNLAKAGSHFQEAIRLDPQSLSRYVDYAEYVGLVREDVDATRALVQTVERLFPDDPRADLKLARVYELIGELDVGIAYGLKGYRLLGHPDIKMPQQLAEEIRGQVAELYAKIERFDEAHDFDPEPRIGSLFLERRYDELIETAEFRVIDHPDDLETVGFLTFAYNVRKKFGQTRQFLEQLLGFPQPPYDNSGGVDGAPRLAYAEAVDALGGGPAFIATDVGIWEQSRDRGTRAWPLLSALACGQALLGRYADALDTLDLVKNAKGLAWSPFIEDRTCFRSLASEPRYLAVVDRLNERKRELRERLPMTLQHYGVADVRP